MSDLTEREVLDRLMSSLKEAGQASIELSLHPRIGTAYRKLREHLLLVEGCCRQISAMRDDSRWLMIGRSMGEAHKRAGTWLRGRRVLLDDGTPVRVSTSMATRNPLFDMLAKNLAALVVAAENLRDKATGVLGPILPNVGRAERRVGAPVPVTLPGEMVSQGGIILPHSGTVH